MSFLAPAFLMALPLLAVPVLIHLFNRRQHDLIRWGAMEFLLAGKTPRRRFMKLRDLLLMLIRAALVLAMIAALAQPMLSLSWSGVSGPRDVVLVLDNSMSTARKLGATTVFARELEEAEKIIGQLGAADRIRVLLASPAPEWLTDGTLSGGGADQRALVAQLRELKPADGSMDMFRSLQEAVKAEPAGKDMTRFVTAITDGQAYGWRAKSPSVWASLQTLMSKSAFPVIANVVMPEGTDGTAANLGIETISARRGVVGVSQPATLTASIKNTGAGTSRGTSLAWSAGDRPLGVSAVPPLQAGAGTTVSISEMFSAPGLVDINCRLADADDLPPDDAAHFLLEVTQSVPVLIVEGEPQSDPIQSDTQYLLAALGWQGERPRGGTTVGSVFQPKVIAYQRLRDEDLAPYQCIVLANVPRLPAEAVQKLVRHVNSGGGLWIALGNQTDTGAFNRLFFAAGAGVSPVGLQPPTGDALDHDKFAAVSPPSADHAATALLADVHRLDIDRAKVYRRHQFDVAKGDPVTVLLRADGGAALAVERDLGRGRVILQAFPLGLAWSNLPLCQAYVVMVHEWLWYLAEPGLVKRNLQPGEVLQVNQPAEASNGGASLEMPGGRTLQLAGLEQDHRVVFRSTKTLAPGEYRLTIHGAKAGQRAEQFLVGRDPEESNLTPLTDEEMQAIAKAGGLNFGGEPLAKAPGQRVAGPPRPIAHWLLLSLVLLLAAEAATAFWLARRKRGTSTPVAMQPGFHV